MMGPTITLVAILVVVSSFLLSPAISGDIPAGISSWCEKTPYPKPCKYFMSHNPKYRVPIKGKSHFFKMSTHLALDRCMNAHTNLYSLGSKCRNPKEKAAWADCMELYDATVRRINNTVDPATKCTATDAQTWLSTALTNLETCRAGFVDFGLSPLLPNSNASALLSNALAMNEGPHYGQTTAAYEGGFPTWVSPGDRKLLQSSTTPKADIVVAQDGSGNYKTVNEAVTAAGKRSGGGRFVIYVKQGTYKENVNIGTKLKNIMLMGDGIGKTIITGSKSVGGGSTTFNSATFSVVGDGFIGRGITFRNTAGAANHQAVAVRSGSDLSVFYQCGFEGYQDTLYVHSERQFYRECDIYGTVDFIFGNAAVVLQSCNIYARDPPNKTNTVTAQGRTDPNQNTGISIHNSRITAASGLGSNVKTYLGRPWQKYSRTVVMKTSLGSLIDPAGWMEWDGTFALDTLYYAEYANTGPGSSTTKRVGWKGYHVISASEAAAYAPGKFIAANSWLPATGVPFTATL